MELGTEKFFVLKSVTESVSNQRRNIRLKIRLRLRRIQRRKFSSLIWNRYSRLWLDTEPETDSSSQIRDEQFSVSNAQNLFETDFIFWDGKFSSLILGRNWNPSPNIRNVAVRDEKISVSDSWISCCVLEIKFV